jgi:pyruvate/2-oxoglutarate dehydrogenase complex dihydrolipoamide dehydrogenase (E3) component
VGAVTDTVGTTVDAPTIDATTVDVVVLGAGSAGEVAATDLATAGLAVALVERDLVGGQCPFTACMPSKALLRPGTALRAAAAVPGVPVAGDLPLDVDAVLQRRDEVSDHWEDDGHVGPLRAAGVALHRGTGRITGPREVTVDADAGVTVLRARHAVLLAAGTEAAVPPIDGLDDVDVWLDAEVTTAHELPGHLVVVGGGVVGCEMATAYADLGSRVTLVQRSAHVLSGEEPTAGALVATALRERGVEVLLGREVARLVPRPDGPDGAATVVLDDGHEVTADRVLLALGRRPATDRVGLDRLGLDPAAYVSVDDRMRATDVEGGWLYAVGDVTGRSLYTHSAKHQARAAVASVLADLAGSEPDLVSWADRLAAPRVTFTDPPVAGVGRTLAAARAGGVDAVEVAMDLGDTAAALVHGRDVGGWAQLVVDRDARRVVGATVVGPEAGELILPLCVVLAVGVDLDALRHVIAPFPTLGEVWTELFRRARAEVGAASDG